MTSLFVFLLALIKNQHIMKTIFLSGLFMLTALSLVKSQGFGLRWVKIHAGNEIPPDAVVGGKDGDGSKLFVAHANYAGNWHPGKTRKDWNTTSIEYGGQEVNVQDYEVLAGNEGLSWTRISQGNIPENAVITGHENQNNLFTCRCEFNGTTQVGKTWQGVNACRIGYGGAGNVVPNFEVLVHSGQALTPQPSGPNPASLIGTWILTTSSTTGCNNSQFNYTDSPCKDNGVSCATVVFTSDNMWSDTNGGKGTYSIDGDKLKLNSAADGSFTEFNFRIDRGVLTETQLQINNCLLTIHYRKGN
jgi:hypothetical protein